MIESSLLKQLVSGSEKALETVIHRYAAYVVAVIQDHGAGLLSSEDEEELASDVFLALWDGASTVKGSSLRPWLAQVAIHKTVDRLRRMKTSLPLSEMAAVSEELAAAQLEQQDEILALRRALRTLSKEDQEIFRRFYALEETTERIAEQMSIPAATVRTRLRRGRIKLKREMEMMMKGGNDK